MEEKQNLKLRGRIVERYGTIEKFADRLGRDRTTVSRILSGKAEISPVDRNAWAYCLGIPENELGLFFSESSREFTTEDPATI